MQRSASKDAGHSHVAVDACADELDEAEEGAKEADEQALEGEASGRDKYKRIQASSAAAVQSQKTSRVQASLVHAELGPGWGGRGGVGECCWGERGLAESCSPKSECLKDAGEPHAWRVGAGVWGVWRGGREVC